jgi:hypothetical protein
MESTEDNSANESSETSPAPSSHLPSWVLRMREKIDASRILHAEAESRIANLNKNVQTLTDKLSEMMPVKPSPLTDNSAISISNNLTLTRKFILTGRKLQLHELPSDTWCHILQYLPIPDAFICKALSTCIHEIIQKNVYWYHVQMHQYSFLHFRSNNCNKPCEIMFSVADYLRKRNQSLRFVYMMKEQRSIPKLRASMNPVNRRNLSRHGSNLNERALRHPLPLFGNTSNRNSNHNEQSEERIMSQSETLNSDFRGFAHIALEAMISLSSHMYTPFAQELMEEGVVTVMVSLLANEEASIQDYACSVLANLLCWEACDLRRRQESFANSTTGTSPLYEQISACNGRKQLPTLLTSPTAAVNIVTKLQYNPDTSVMNRIGSSRIQGVCNKNASRVLIIMFYPDFPVYFHHKLFTIDKNYNNSPNQQSNGSTSNKLTKEPLPTIPSSPLLSQQLTTSYQQQQSVTLPNNNNIVTPLKENDTSHLHLPPIQLTKKLSSSNNSTPLKSIWAFPSIDESLVSPSNEAKPTVSSSHIVQQPTTLFEQLQVENTMRPWQFTYFYKSGAFKDQFITHLRFGVTNNYGQDVIGGGIDNIGPFTMKGEKQIDIIGDTIFFQKSYLQGSESSQLTEDALMEKIRLDELSSSSSSSSSAAANTLMNPASVHVVHIAYWSDGLPNNQKMSEQSRQLETTAYAGFAGNFELW